MTLTTQGIEKPIRKSHPTSTRAQRGVERGIITEVAGDQSQTVETGEEREVRTEGTEEEEITREGMISGLIPLPKTMSSLKALWLQPLASEEVLLLMLRAFSKAFNQ